MSSKPIKIGATVLVLGLAFAGLMYSTLSEGTEFYKHVDEVMANPAAWQGKRRQLGFCMATLGTFLLLASFVVASYALASSVAGARRRSRRLIESGIGAFYLVAALMTAASVIIVHAFVTG